MINKKIIAGVSALVLTGGIVTGVSVYLNKDYDEYTVSGNSISSETVQTQKSETQIDKEPQQIKQTIQNITYDKELFEAEAINIDITVDETEWQNMLDNATAEEYISVDISINGNIMENVGIRPKGNSSLATVSQSESDKYSFKMKFDKYVDEQTCYGLDTLVLNNVISDNTYMKDYISFDMMNFMGVNSSLYNYSYITVNGEFWGVYIALEGYDKSFLNRTYGNDEGFLYNVKSMEVNGEGMKKPENFESLTTMPGETLPEVTYETNENGEMIIPEIDEFEAETPPEMPIVTDENGQSVMPDMENFKGGFGGKDTGGSLMYTDNNWESYSAIFDNAVFNRTSEEDYQRVITALEMLSKGENIEEYFDVDQILRYLAVHTTLVNLDSYSSNMAQNYYLYEKDGKISILPWDYNLAFGGFSANDSTTAINFPVDTPVSNVSLEERPLIAQILAVDEYKQKYHEYLNQIVEEYFDSGYFEEKVDTINNKISSYVEDEPQAFCTYDEYNTAVSTLKTFGKKRAESIKGQLNGTIPSTSEEQKQNQDALIKDESIKISDMGTQNGGGMHGGGFGGDRVPFETDESGQMVMPEGIQTDENGQIVMHERGNRPFGNRGEEFVPPENFVTDENGEMVIPEMEERPFEKPEFSEEQYQSSREEIVIQPQIEEVPQVTQPPGEEYQPVDNFNPDNRR